MYSIGRYVVEVISFLRLEKIANDCHLFASQKSCFKIKTRKISLLTTPLSSVGYTMSQIWSNMRFFSVHMCLKNYTQKVSFKLVL